MYLKEIFVKDSGPVRALTLALQFDAEGRPIPLVLVGGNGSGKTSILSAIADALFQAAAIHYKNALRGQIGLEKPWFRLVGGSTIAVNASGSVVLMRFQEGEEDFFFREKGGTVEASAISSDIPVTFKPVLQWPTEGALKDFNFTDEQSREIFDKGVYIYFPSSRSEFPHWMNTEAQEPEFDFQTKIQGRLNKPIFVERGVEPLQSWILDLLLESRFEVELDLQVASEPGKAPISWNMVSLLRSAPAIVQVGFLNQILAEILQNRNARFISPGRHAVSKIAVGDAGNIMIPSIRGLSAGQSTLLSVFGTILRYADLSNQIGGAGIEGICIIDEIDAHMHVSLQYEVIPRLVKMFPKIQFVISTHSPLCALGLQRELTPEGVCIVDMPSGIRIDAEQFSEFEQALTALKDTKAFRQALQDIAAQPGKKLVLLEGETDPTYLRKAVELLGFDNMLAEFEFEWVGAKDPKSGQGYHTGKDALNQTLKVFKANPDLIRRNIVLLYDNDTGISSEDIGRLHVRIMPCNPLNTRVEAGIENLLSQRLISDEMYEVKDHRKKNGSFTRSHTLQKMRLCEKACRVGTADDFEGFRGVLEMIQLIECEPLG